jgi:DNA-binding HxlR family transcriptional regulator
MKRTPFSEWPCSVARTVDLLGDWWTPLVLREAYYGTRRFEDFQRNLAIGRNILTQRLTRLVDEGLFDRVPYHDRPLRHEYVLTTKGRDFFPVLAAMWAWGDKWLGDPDGPPVVMIHKSCGHQTHAEVVCAHCHEPLEVRDVRSALGPGFPRTMKAAALASGRFVDDEAAEVAHHPTGAAGPESALSP